MSLTFGRADPSDPDVAALVQAHMARAEKYYPPEACHCYDTATLQDRGVVLFVARDAGAALAIGGYLPLDGTTAEMKSVFTSKAARGKGIGAAIVRHLIAEARAAGYQQIFLETGNDAASAAARAVYEKLGFSYRGPFGDYGEDPLSAYMEATL